MLIIEKGGSIPVEDDDVGNKSCGWDGGYKVQKR